MQAQVADQDFQRLHFKEVRWSQPCPSVLQERSRVALAAAWRGCEDQLRASPAQISHFVEKQQLRPPAASNKANNQIMQTSLSDK